MADKVATVKTGSHSRVRRRLYAYRPIVYRPTGLYRYLYGRYERLTRRATHVEGGGTIYDVICIYTETGQCLPAAGGI